MWSVGDKCWAQWSDGHYYFAQITAVLPGDQAFEVNYLEYNEVSQVALSQLLHSSPYEALDSSSGATLLELIRRRKLVEVEVEDGVLPDLQAEQELKAGKSPEPNKSSEPEGKSGKPRLLDIPTGTSTSSLGLDSPSPTSTTHGSHEFSPSSKPPPIPPKPKRPPLPSPLTRPSHVFSDDEERPSTEKNGNRREITTTTNQQPASNLTSHPSRAQVDVCLSLMHQKGDVLGAFLQDTDPARAVMEATVTELITAMPVVGALLVSLNSLSSLGSDVSTTKLQALRKALERRAQESAAINQSIMFLNEAKLFPSSVASTWSLPLEPLGFLEEVNKMVQEAGFEAKGMDFGVPEWSHPFEPDKLIQSIVIKKIFHSNTKPALLALYTEPFHPTSDGLKKKTWSKEEREANVLRVTQEEQTRVLLWALDVHQGHEIATQNTSVRKGGIMPNRCRDVILKFGEDIRQDVFCLEMFRLMNKMWSRHGLDYCGIPVVARDYGAVALGPTLGIIDFVDHCLPLSLLDPSIKLTWEQVNRFVATAAGSFIAAYVIGIRDRHSDNILLLEDGSVFHIDFGHILGNGVTIDTGPFAITPEFKQLLKERPGPGGTQWVAFVSMCSLAYQVLRLQAETLVKAAVLLMGPLFPNLDVEGYIRNSLFCHMSERDGRETLMRLVRKAPRDYKTRVKNLLHGIAQVAKQPTNRPSPAKFKKKP